MFEVKTILVDNTRELNGKQRNLKVTKYADLGMVCSGKKLQHQLLYVTLLNDSIIQPKMKRT